MRFGISPGWDHSRAYGGAMYFQPAPSCRANPSCARMSSIREYLYTEYAGPSSSKAGEIRFSGDAQIKKGREPVPNAGSRPSLGNVLKQWATEAMPGRPFRGPISRACFLGELHLGQVERYQDNLSVMRNDPLKIVHCAKFIAIRASARILIMADRESSKFW